MKKKHPEYPAWFRQRNTIHFDKKLCYEDVLEYVSNPENIAKHAFYPFIRFNLIKKIYKRDKSIDKRGKLLKEPKEREISYASHLDSHIFSFYAEKLKVKYESLLENEDCRESIIAYRKLKKSNVDFAGDAFRKVKELCEANQQHCVIAICYDIEDFYGSLDHKILKEKLCEILQVGSHNGLPRDYFNIYKAITKFSWVDRENLLETLKIKKRWLSAINYFCQNGQEFREKVRANKLIKVNEENAGIPQGSSISPLLSNIYMLPFDREMIKYAKQTGAFYQRYCDDILWVCLETDKNDLEEKKSHIENELLKLCLKINVDKTRESLFKYNNGKIENIPLKDKNSVPLEYLGFTFNGERCFLRNKTLSNYYIRLSRFIIRTKKLAASSRKNRGKIYLGKIYSKFFRLGKKKGKETNFILYASNADSKLKNAGLESGVRHQIRKHWNFIHRQIKKEKIMDVDAIGVMRTSGKDKEGKDVDFVKLHVLRPAKSSDRYKKLETEEVGKIPEGIYVNIDLYSRLKTLTYPCTLRLETEDKISQGGQIVREVKDFEDITDKSV